MEIRLAPVKGFGRNRIQPEEKLFWTMPGWAAGSDHDHRQVLQVGVGLDLLGQGWAVQARHEGVGDHGVEGGSSQAVQGLSTVAGRGHTIVLLGQDGPGSAPEHGGHRPRPERVWGPWGGFMVGGQAGEAPSGEAAILPKVRGNTKPGDGPPAPGNTGKAAPCKGRRHPHAMQGRR